MACLPSARGWLAVHYFRRGVLEDVADGGDGRRLLRNRRVPGRHAGRSGEDEGEFASFFQAPVSYLDPAVADRRIPVVQVPRRRILHRASFSPTSPPSSHSPQRPRQIYGPDGSTLVDPVDPGVEAILYADISLDKIDEVKLIADNQVRRCPPARSTHALAESPLPSFYPGQLLPLGSFPPGRLGQIPHEWKLGCRSLHRRTRRGGPEGARRSRRQRCSSA